MIATLKDVTLLGIKEKEVKKTEYKDGNYVEVQGETDTLRIYTFVDDFGDIIQFFSPKDFTELKGKIVNVELELKTFQNRIKPVLSTVYTS